MGAPPLTLLVSFVPKLQGLGSLFPVRTRAAVDDEPRTLEAAADSSHPVQAVALHVATMASRPALAEEVPDLLIAVAAESERAELLDCAAEASCNAA
jgi:hypothetical protein